MAGFFVFGLGALFGCGGVFSIRRSTSSGDGKSVFLLMAELPIAEVYVDESSQCGHKFLVLTAMIVRKDDRIQIVQDIDALRTQHRLINHEISWTAVSNAKLEGYRAVVEKAHEQIIADDLHVHCLWVDTSTFDHRTHSKGDREAGFNKLIFQLLLHKIGRRYSDIYRFEVYLDQRTTNQEPDDLRKMLNATLTRDWQIGSSPFRLVTFMDSKKGTLIQMADIFAGAIAYRKNEWHLKPDANKAKCGLAEHMSKRCGAIISSERGKTQYTLWSFRYNAW